MSIGNLLPYLRQKGILICGLRGSGKTTLAKSILSHFSTIVYAENKMEWQDCGDNIILYNYIDFINDIQDFLKIAIKLPKIEFLVIDGFDLLFGHSSEKVSEDLRRLWISMRHYGKSVILITRRPQDIPARLWNTMDILLISHYEIPSLIDLLNKIEDGLGNMVKMLEKYEFVAKSMNAEFVTFKFKVNANAVL